MSIEEREMLCPYLNEIGRRVWQIAGGRSTRVYGLKAADSTKEKIACRNTKAVPGDRVIT